MCDFWHMHVNNRTFYKGYQLCKRSIYEPAKNKHKDLSILNSKNV